MRTGAALVTSFPVRAARLERLVGGAGFVVRLAHPREHEHLVVHREPEQEGEDHHRDVRRDQASRYAPEGRGRVPAGRPDDDPEGRTSETRFSSTALTASTIERNARVEQDQREQQDEGKRVRKAAEQGVQEVAVDRGDAGQRAARSHEASRWRDRRSPGCRGRRRRSRRTLRRRGLSTTPFRRCGRSDHSGHRGQLRRDL